MEYGFYILLFSFFLIAVLYSSVGFGGGSLYLAMLAIVATSFDVIRPTALICNIVVVTGGVYIFYKKNLIDVRRAAAFIIPSVPFAFAGASVKLEQSIFFMILGFTLLIASVLLWIQPESASNTNSRRSTFSDGLIGAGVGFLSGLVGIGGGIFLSPFLHLTGWDTPGRISALASLFILVNSIGGLSAVLMTTTPDWGFIAPLGVAVFLGGQIGSRIGTSYFKAVHVKRVTAVIICIAAITILKEHLF